jgi:hypothetical protein
MFQAQHLASLAPSFAAAVLHSGSILCTSACCIPQCCVPCAGDAWLYLLLGVLLTLCVCCFSCRKHTWLDDAEARTDVS